MMVSRLFGAAVLGLALLVSALVMPAAAERRVALVIGNSSYKSIVALSNPRNDAEDMSSALRSLGFEVMLRTDVQKNDIRNVLKDFSRLTSGADTALVFYAGHALQYQGRFFLVPVDAALEDEDALKFDMLPADDLKDVISKVSGVRILIFDACRNDPFTEKPQPGGVTPPSGVTRGLTRVRKVQGSVTVFATAPFEVAEDGKDRHSPFTRALLKRLSEPGLEIARLFRLVTKDVADATGGRQLPEITISMLDDYYLNRGESDAMFWARIRFSGQAADLRDFISRFPDSSFLEDARFRLAALEVTERAAEEELRRIERRRREEEQRKLCAAEASEIEAARGAGRRDQLDDLARRVKCPVSAEAITRAKADIAAAEAAEKARREAEEKAKREAEAAEKARIAAEAAEKAKREAEAAQVRREAEEKARREAEAAEKARIAAEAAEKAKREAEAAQVRREAEEKARREAEAAERARIAAEAAEKAKREAMTAQARREAEEKARRDAEAAEKARREAEVAEKARIAAEAAEKAKREAEAAQARREAEEKARREAEAAEKARIAAEAAEKAKRDAMTAQARREAEEKARREAEAAEKARREAETICAQERAEVERLKQAGEAGREALARLRDGLRCPAIAPLVVAALEPPPVVRPVDPAPLPPVSNRQIQTALKRVGCWEVLIDEKDDKGTRRAAARYLERRGQKTAADELSLDAGLLARLEAEPQARVCPLECGTGEIEQNGRCVATKKPERTKPAQAKPDRQPPRPVAREQAKPAAPPPEVRRPPAQEAPAKATPKLSPMLGI
ncbi:MAG: caspase family protein [Siculibacillus sp.]|nr:caspase family protein [Siculibacillus sp.]